MSKLAWKPWHQVVQLRKDLKSGELSLAMFAADIYDVAMDRPDAPKVYRDPREFFALTYPTFNLRELAKDVCLRLAGRNDKAVRQLELTYGGGKTHTLITLYHLVRDPGKLPDLPAAQEFVQHIGQQPPKARVAVLPFDKLDVEKGMEVRSPKGEKRWLKNPWSVLAYQIAGSEGLKLLHAEGKDAERDSAPAENLLIDLLSLPVKEGLATLVLIDEVLMYAREKVVHDPAWRIKLTNFFQYLTQAATKVRTCAVVASLLATDPRKSDQLGKEITQELYAIFRREREEGVQPVVKEDVAEILRRRFFTPESIRDREAFRPHVVAALRGIADLDDQTRKEGKSAEERLLKSYPFHPDLTEVLYGKWTSLEGFQRTRGVLRTFALALRDAEKWDQSSLVAANVFLGGPGKGGISEASRELTTVAATEEYEGRKQEWTAILEGELAKARGVQEEATALKFREVEQAIFATFLHSQPVGQKALTRDLLLLLGHTRPDKIELEKALRRWTEVSWFLDEAFLADAEAAVGVPKELPKAWRLGSRPNLRQMHHDACTRVSPDLVEAKLLDEIGKVKSLTEGAQGAGARVHKLPEKPRDVEDDGDFHYVILGPKAVSDPGKPSAEAKRFLDETTGPDRPRVYRNAVVLVAPSRDGLEAARDRIRDQLGWLEVQDQLKDQAIDAIRAETLVAYIESARKRIPEAIQQAYCLCVTVSERNEALSSRVAVGSDPLFTIVKNDSRSRIQDTPVSAEALLPGGPYDLWKEGEASRRVKDLVGAFAQFPHLPKMLRRKEILDTLVLGAREGSFVLRSIRPDRSMRTVWREDVEEADLKDPSLEVVLPEVGELTHVAPVLLEPGRLPGLWTGDSITVRDAVEFFSGGKVLQVARNGYEEPVTIPKAARNVVHESIRTAVRTGRLWLTSGPATILGEEIPTGLLADDARLQAPPSPISATDLLPLNLPHAWVGDETTGVAISAALSRSAGKSLPWPVIRDAIDGALRARLVELAVESGPWPCDFPGAPAIRLRLPKEPPPPPPPPPEGLVTEAELRPDQLQDLAETIPELLKASAGAT